MTVEISNLFSTDRAGDILNNLLSILGDSFAGDLLEILADWAAVMTSYLLFICKDSASDILNFQYFDRFDC